MIGLLNSNVEIVGSGNLTLSSVNSSSSVTVPGDAAFITVYFHPGASSDGVAEKTIQVKGGQVLQVTSTSSGYVVIVNYGGITLWQYSGSNLFSFTNIHYVAFDTN